MTRERSANLKLTDVRFGFADRPDFLGPVAVCVEGGECWSVVGPNGAGKSTLLGLMAGLRQPGAGEARLGGTALGRMPGRERARRIAFVPQNPPGDVNLSVRDVVLMGRFPHRSFGLFESASDHRIAEQAMETTQTLSLADRAMSTLSGGEAQRVHVAAAVCQEPELLLLDEPTASLDLQHQLGIFRILRDRATRDGLAVVVVTHDVNLAAQFSTHVLLLDDGRVVATGRPADVLKPEVLSPVYDVELKTLSIDGDAEHRWIVPIEHHDKDRGRRQ